MGKSLTSLKKKYAEHQEVVQLSKHIVEDWKSLLSKEGSASPKVASPKITARDAGVKQEVSKKEEKSKEVKSEKAVKSEKKEKESKREEKTPVKEDKGTLGKRKSSGICPFSLYFLSSLISTNIHLRLHLF